MDKLDPRTRWIFSIAFLFSVTMFWDLRFLLFYFILAFGWYFSARITWKESRRGWMLVSFLLLTMIIINTIITGGGAGGVVPPGGNVVWPDGFTFPITNWEIHFGLTYERLWFAICQLLRISGISAVFLIIPFSMDPRVYGVTFRRLGFPDNFAYSMELAFRYVPTLARDFNTTFDAQRARGYEIERINTNLVKQILQVAPLIVPVAMNSILMGEDVTDAMNLRCFGQYPRTWITQLKYNSLDYFVIGFSILMLFGSLALTVFTDIGGFWVPDAFLKMVGVL
jgi:energy-coupling factor transport system permease protein